MIRVLIFRNYSPCTIFDRVLHHDLEAISEFMAFIRIARIYLAIHVTLLETVMSTSASRRVQKHRDALRAAGLRPIQIWVPDTRRAEFADECRRQAILVAKSDHQDTGLSDFMNTALSDLDGWH